MDVSEDCLFEFALARQVANSEHSCVRSLRSLASLGYIDVAFLTGVQRGLRLYNLLRQEGARQLLMRMSRWSLHGLRQSPHRAWSIGQARASFLCAGLPILASAANASGLGRIARGHGAKPG